MGIIELLVAIVTPFIICKSGIKPKNRKKVVEEIDSNTVRIRTQRGPIYVKGLRVEDIDSVKLLEEYDEIIRMYTQFLNRLNLDVALEIRLLKKSIDPVSIIKSIERELTHLKVQKMNDPTDIRIELRIGYLEKLLKLYSTSTLPSRIEINYLLYSRGLERLEAEKYTLKNLLSSLFKAQVRDIDSRELKKMVNPKVVKENGIVVPSIALALANPPLESTISDGIYLGIDIESNRIEFIPPTSIRHHIGVIGSTGMGKTTILASLIIRIHLLLSYVNVIVIDPKGDLEYILREMEIPVQVYRFKGTSTLRKEEINRVIENILDEIVNMEPSKDLRKVIVVDEAWLIESNLLEEIAREGRSKGISLIVATQSPSDLSYEIWSNIGTWIVLKLNRLDKDNWICTSLRDYCSYVTLLRKGEALVKFHNGRIKMIRLDVDEVIQSITTNLKSSIPNSFNNLETESGEITNGSSTNA
ncbi:hypothetical protein EYM_07605 [Ignicoccus islandicus DSM 13165]|uniref:AAA+ ATPase domain-containing protein n=1 Tax=Ignicoccus islandicus DSM 13165 TaxID=940295 RepID=A0A0U3F9T5_9CREN|nr:DUF87 domain-containing protein [Ignicoccus islandicus]ALU12792.1 hypothetical protein EYM_07605 [Ignicoccus islandicus DSM 13165]